MVPIIASQRAKAVFLFYHFIAKSHEVQKTRRRMNYATMCEGLEVLKLIRIHSRLVVDEF